MIKVCIFDKSNDVSRFNKATELVFREPVNSVEVKSVLVKLVDGAINSVETLSDWKSLNHNPFLNAIVLIVSKSAYGSRIPQVEVNLITYKNCTQSISHLGVRPDRHVYTTMTQQSIAYNWNIINMCTSTHALLPVVPRPSLPPRRPTLPKPSLPRPSLPTPARPGISVQFSRYVLYSTRLISATYQTTLEQWRCCGHIAISCYFSKFIPMRDLIRGKPCLHPTDIDNARVGNTVRFISKNLTDSHKY